MNQEFSSPEIVTEVSNGTGIITLNRPQALNALSFSMVSTIADILSLWAEDPGIARVLFLGAGDRAFCAGGDMKAVYHMGFAEAVEYFRAEYALNRQIFHYPKPTIAYMDGIVMGGGYGIAGHCKMRVASERTLFAMPETAIGFFPDVGSLYHLTRCPQSAGRYLALTGVRIKAGDMIHARLADAFLPEADMDHVLKENFIPGLMPENDFSPGPAEKIAEIFRHPDLTEIRQALEADDSPWAEETLNLLRRRSPTSLAVTNRHYNLSAGQEMDAVLNRDFQLAQKFLNSHDLREGVRAVLIDRDNDPHWSPENLESVDSQALDGYFDSKN